MVGFDPLGLDSGELKSVTESMTEPFDEGKGTWFIAQPTVILDERLEMELAQFEHRLSRIHIAATLGVWPLNRLSFGWVVAGRFASGMVASDRLGLLRSVRRFDWMGHFDRGSKAACAIVAMRP